jgi:hypothetical protein
MCAPPETDPREVADEGGKRTASGRAECLPTWTSLRMGHRHERDADLPVSILEGEQGEAGIP